LAGGRDKVERRPCGGRGRAAPQAEVAS
jgi:hypothetical protein